ncbi:hypothetical protein VB715_19625 [Crocosphaera sp. UHCC 0190]|uniref:hypothetical protein n=1 Tax=Crocosphaera sp. UHCC 0190 TaxID=3110246 RepID=UPI002B1F3693|nr:hypothetical protein [Crocosphaera sp. UHCC 0190]MEA5511986.1 hypothetical protein [Crocosphaera sp. UHCC 0190]
MLVVLTHENILSVQQVCPGCLLSNHQGQPRWYQGHLGCGHSLDQREREQVSLYECEMGFQIAEVQGEPI